MGFNERKGGKFEDAFGQVFKRICLTIGNIKTGLDPDFSKAQSSEGG